MATLKSYTQSTYGSPYAYYKLVVTEVDRTATKVKLKATAYGYLATSSSSLGTGLGLTAGIKVGGSWKTWTLKGTSSVWSGTAVHSESKTFWVSASASTKTLTGIEFRVLRSDSYGNGAEMSAKDCSNMAISQYATATKPSLNATSLYMGYPLTIELDPDLSEYTHTLKWSFGGQTGLIAEKTSKTVITWTPDAATLAPLIPYDWDGVCTITCTSYYGSWSDSETAKVTLKVPDYSLSATMTVAEGNESNPFGTYTQNISKLKVDIECAAQYGAILSYKTTVGGAVIGDSSSFTSDPLLFAGDLEVVTTVTDSRKKTVSVSQIITAYAYDYPKVVLAHRQVGDVAKFALSGSISTVNGENNASVYIECTKIADGAKTTHPIAIIITGAFSTTTEITIDSTQTYEFRAVLTDKVNDPTYSNVISTGVICISRFAGGKGVTLFEEATGNGFKVGDGQPSHFTGSVTMDNPLGFTQGGTGVKVTSKQTLLEYLLGYTPSYIQIRTTATVNTWSTTLQYFYPYAEKAVPKVFSRYKGNLTMVTNKVTFGDREDVTTYGVRIGKNINTVRVHSNVYFLSETESPTGVCATIYRWRESAETKLTAYSQAFTHVEASNGSYGTCTSNAIIAVKEGDFIFVGAWKSTASRKIYTPYGSGRTNMIVEAIG